MQNLPEKILVWVLDRLVAVFEFELNHLAERHYIVIDTEQGRESLSPEAQYRIKNTPFYFSTYAVNHQQLYRIDYSDYPAGENAATLFFSDAAILSVKPASGVQLTPLAGKEGFQFYIHNSIGDASDPDLIVRKIFRLANDFDQQHILRQVPVVQEDAANLLDALWFGWLRDKGSDGTGDYWSDYLQAYLSPQHRLSAKWEFANPDPGFLPDVNPETLLTDRTLAPKIQHWWDIAAQPVFRYRLFAQIESAPDVYLLILAAMIMMRLPGAKILYGIISETETSPKILLLANLIMRVLRLSGPDGAVHWIPGPIADNNRRELRDRAEQPVIRFTRFGKKQYSQLNLPGGEWIKLDHMVQFSLQQDGRKLTINPLLPADYPVELPANRDIRLEINGTEFTFPLYWQECSFRHPEIHVKILQKKKRFQIMLLGRTPETRIRLNGENIDFKKSLKIRRYFDIAVEEPRISVAVYCPNGTRYLAGIPGEGRVVATGVSRYGVFASNIAILHHGKTVVRAGGEGCMNLKVSDMKAGEKTTVRIRHKEISNTVTGFPHVVLDKFLKHSHGPLIVVVASRLKPHSSGIKQAIESDLNRPAILLCSDQPETCLRRQTGLNMDMNSQVSIAGSRPAQFLTVGWKGQINLPAEFVNMLEEKNGQKDA
jgi:hypothetical protein